MHRQEFFRWIGSTTVSVATVAPAQNQVPGPEPAHADVPCSDARLTDPGHPDPEYPHFREFLMRPPAGK